MSGLGLPEGRAAHDLGGSPSDFPASYLHLVSSIPIRMHYDLCCIGHITLDTVITESTTVHMPGGTAYYFSQAVSGLDLSYLLVTALAESETGAAQTLQQKGIEVQCWPSRQTVYFENRYSTDQDFRTQRVLQQADPFVPEQFSGVEAGIFHLGPLLAQDLSPGLIRTLAAKGKISLDVQGFLRRVENQTVVPVDWEDKEEILPHIHFLKLNEEEMQVLTGLSDIRKGAKALSDRGAREVIVTLGSRGSLVYASGSYFVIPAFRPQTVTDATGCGDTYMAGYLYQRIKGTGIQQAGEFAAAMARLKIESSGPFTGTREHVSAVLKEGDKVVTEP